MDLGKLYGCKKELPGISLVYRWICSGKNIFLGTSGQYFGAVQFTSDERCTKVIHSLTLKDDWFELLLEMCLL